MRGWLLGTIDGVTSGIMPANYLKLMGKKVVQQNQTQTTCSPVTSQTIPTSTSNTTTTTTTSTALPVSSNVTFKSLTEQTSPKSNSPFTASYSMEDLFNQS